MSAGTAGDVVDKNIDNRIVGAGFRIRFDVDRVLYRGLLHLNIEILHGTLIETVVTDFTAVRRPPDRGCLRKLLAINPAPGTILDSRRNASIARHLAL